MAAQEECFLRKAFRGIQNAGTRFSGPVPPVISDMRWIV
jgi:hypothetical protein